MINHGDDNRTQHSCKFVKCKTLRQINQRLKAKASKSIPQYVLP